MADTHQALISDIQQCLQDHTAPSLSLLESISPLSKTPLSLPLSPSQTKR